MGKYEPLSAFLKSQNRDFVPMTFSEIERVLKLSLPPSKRNRAWWSNNPSNNVMTKEWLDAGYETESVDIAGEKLVFRRVKRRVAERSSQAEGARRGTNSSEHPGFGFMKGLLMVEAGYDLTQPSEEDWENGYLGLEPRDGR